ncbi:MAG: hypothetical protein KF712_00615 [Akkermansiaceae bacterium]|nr:hypothetical protein [Akkermansiaceae bacterium]
MELRSEVYGIPRNAAADPADGYSTLWLVRRDGIPSATLRVTYARNGPLDCEANFPPDLLARYRAIISSSSRFCMKRDVPPEARVARMLIETAWRDGLPHGIRLDIIDVNVRAMAYYRRLGYTLLPGNSFIHPLLKTPSEVMVCTVDPACHGPLQMVFADCPDPLPLERIMRPTLLLPSGEITGRTGRVKVATFDRGVLRPGDMLSFSAGTTKANPSKCRIVAAQPEKFTRLLGRFPEIGRMLGGNTPVIINAYPAPVGAIVQGIAIDSYGRQPAISSALILAAEQGFPVALIGMPLAVAHFLIEHGKKDGPFPRELVLFVGGHHCPRSLEKFLNGFLSRAGCHTEMAHLYGVAELDAALMAAKYMQERLVYHGIDCRWEPVVEGGVLGFMDKHDSGMGICIVDEDASYVEGGIELRNQPERLMPEVLEELESWTEREWARRTGFVILGESGFHFQLRAGEKPESPDEMEHYDFARQQSFSWLDKPSWGRSTELSCDG